MKLLIPILLLAAAWPVYGEPEPRFELRSRLTPAPEPAAGRFALVSRLDPARASEPPAGGDRFALKQAPAPSGAACADPVFADGFE